MTGQLPEVLLVDDEQSVLDGVRRHLRGSATVHTATSAGEGLRLLAEHDVAVIVSDMRMPGLDGADFLALAARRRPDATRVVLSGECELTAAVRAVNQGRVFRFLTKPCRPDELLGVIAEGAEQQRLRRVERSLLEETLKGAVGALLDALALADPCAFARAVRVGRLVQQMAAALDEPSWEVQVAGMLGQIGCLGLPRHVTTALETGATLKDAELGMVQRIPAVGAQLLAGIPRLDEVRDAIRWQRARFDGPDRRPSESAAPERPPHGAVLPLGARLLRVAVDADALTARGLPPADVLQGLAADPGAHDPAAVAALGQVFATQAAAAATPAVIPIAKAAPGMVLVDDVRTEDGQLLAGRGTAITEPMTERLSNYVRSGRLRDHLVVLAG